MCCGPASFRGLVISVGDDAVEDNVTASIAATEAIATSDNR